MGSNFLHHLWSPGRLWHWETGIKGYPLGSSRVSSEENLDCSPSTVLRGKEAAYPGMACLSSYLVHDDVRRAEWRSMVRPGTSPLAIPNASSRGMYSSTNP